MRFLRTQCGGCLFNAMKSTHKNQLRWYNYLMNKYVLFFCVLISATAVVLFLKSAPKEGDYNVIIIAFDGLQAKHLHSQGYPLNTTPNLDKFISESYLFKRAVSPASWTVPAFMSIFTSRYPSEHKVTNKLVEVKSEDTIKTETANLKKLNPLVVTLAEILKMYGYATAGFTGDAGVSAVFGYNAGFDEYYDKETFGGFDLSAPKALDWLYANKDKRFFLFLHGYDVHGQHEPVGGFDYRYVKKPYNGSYTGSSAEQATLREEGLTKGSISLPSEDVEFWRAIYDEKISRADDEFGKFMKEVENMGLMKNTIFVVLSDHGTEFYEHSRFDHGHTLYGELLNVIFAIRLPGQESGKYISSLVSTLDVTPTILAAVGLKDAILPSMRGIDISPAFYGQDVSHEVFSETDYRLYTHKRSIETPDGWKYILTMENLDRELYDLGIDQNETQNLATTQSEITSQLEAKIYSHLNQMNSSGPWLLGCLQVYSDQCKPSLKTSVVKPNIVIINIDSLRMDHMGIYGYNKPTTPFLDSFFARGVIFENAVAPAYLTFQTDASILSGLYPSQNDVMTFDTPIDNKIDTLPKILRQYGYNTAAFASLSLRKNLELDRQFDRYYYDPNPKNVAERKKEVANWLINAKEPFFVFWHVFDVHIPYLEASSYFYPFDYGGAMKGTMNQWAWSLQTSSEMVIGQKNYRLTPEDEDYIKGSYDTGVRYTNNELEQFFKMVASEPFFNNTIFIISSEHGEDLKEHGFFFHGDVYDVNLHVPLAIVGPGLPTHRISEPVSLIDLAPTILSFIGNPIAYGEGSDLTPIFRGETLGERNIFFERPPFDEYGVRRGDWKYILRNPIHGEAKVRHYGSSDWFFDHIAMNDPVRGDELFNIKNDPYELHNVIGTNVEAEDYLRKVVYEFADKMKMARELQATNGSIKQHPPSIFTYP